MRGRKSLRSGWALPRTAALLQDRRARLLAAVVAVLYVSLSLLTDGRVFFSGTRGPGAISFSMLGGLVVSGGGWTVTLPLWSAALSITVALGVGVGMGSGALVALRVISLERTPSRRGRELGPLSSLPPAMLSVLSLGAFCSVTAAAWAGLGGVVSLGGSSSLLGVSTDLLLSLVQLVVLGASLLAQESLLRLFPARFLGVPRVRRRMPAWEPEPITPRRGALARYRHLLAAGCTASVGLALVQLVSDLSSGTWSHGVLVGSGSATEWALGLLALSILPAAAVAWTSEAGLTGSARSYRTLLILLGAMIAAGAPLTIPVALPDGGRDGPPFAGPGSEGLRVPGDLELELRTGRGRLRAALAACARSARALLLWGQGHSQRGPLDSRQHGRAGRSCSLERWPRTLPEPVFADAQLFDRNDRIANPHLPRLLRSLRDLGSLLIPPGHCSSSLFQEGVKA